MSKIEISEKDSELLGLIEQLVTEGVANGIKKGIEQARNEERLKEKITYDTRIKKTPKIIIEKL